MELIKVVRPFAAMLLPASGSPWVATAFAAAASVGTVCMPVNSALKWLAVSIAFDLFTGFMCKRKGLPRPNISMIGALVSAACYALAQYLAKQPELQWDIIGRTWGVGEFFAVWFLIIHMGNITRNMDDLDTPFPKSVNSLISTARSFFDTAEIGGPIVSVFKSSMTRTGGSTEVKSETKTTVVTTPPTMEKT